jgi:hypothetical protein
MPFMQCTHGGHKANASAGASRFFAYSRDFSGGGQDEHFAFEIPSAARDPYDFE